MSFAIKLLGPDLLVYTICCMQFQPWVYDCFVLLEWCTELSNESGLLSFPTYSVSIYYSMVDGYMLSAIYFRNNIKNEVDMH